MQPLPADLEEWLKRFAAAVRARDMQYGRTLFADDAVSFGTVCFRTESLGELASRQWLTVWPNTRDFDFDYASAVAMVDAAHATVLATWTSTGFLAGDQPVERIGRATLVLRRSPSGWKAVHSHFSIAPTPDHDPVLRHAPSPVDDPQLP